MSDLTTTRPKAFWESKNPVLPEGRSAFEEETGKLKIGDGTTRWMDLPFEDVPPYTLPSTSTNFVVYVNAGSDLSAKRPHQSGVVYWNFDAGVDVGAEGANIVNRKTGDVYFVASA